MGNYRILISFCNMPVAKEYPLLALSLDPANLGTGTWQPVSLGGGITTHHVTGLTMFQDLILIAHYLDEASWITALDFNTLEFKWRQCLWKTRDAHSIAIHHGVLLVASTGTEQILAYRIKNDQLCEPYVYWQGEESGKDIKHLNSVFSANGKALVSSFGPKRSDLWSSSARNGYLYCIEDQEMIKDNLDHPHTVYWRNGQIYYCESMRGTLCSIDEELCQVEGYTRGITWLSDDIVVFASSIGRTVSRSHGVILSPGDPGEKTGSCQLIGFDLRQREIIFKHNAEFQGPEIYDLLAF